MSFTEFSAPEKGASTESGRQRFTEFSLNEIFTEELKLIQEEMSSSHLVIRSESLPDIRGEVLLIRQCLRTVLRLILEHAGTGSRIFLHIYCEEEKAQKDKARYYHVRLQSNISIDPDWKLRHRNELALCHQIISLHDGHFSVNNITHTGCLFSIILPGKPD